MTVAGGMKSLVLPGWFIYPRPREEKEPALLTLRYGSHIQGHGSADMKLGVQPKDFNNVCVSGVRSKCVEWMRLNLCC